MIYNLDKGCIYVATGIKYVEEAVRSAQSFKAAMPEISIWLWSDLDPKRQDLFDKVVHIKNPARSFEDKIRPLLESPFHKTIFLDTDTYVCGSLDDVYQILDRFDFAAAHPVLRVTRVQDLPDAFPEVNSGVMAFRSSDALQEVFKKWLQLYAKHVEVTGQLDDQPPLRVALYESNLRIAILPPEYNLRTILPGAIGRGRVKVIHGRQRNMKSVEAMLNNSQRPRVFFTQFREFLPRHLIFLSAPGRFFGSLFSIFGWLGFWIGKFFDGLFYRLNQMRLSVFNSQSPF
jgi:hypothetical protein